MKRKLSISLVLVGMFALGAVTGAAVMRIRIAQGVQNRLIGRGVGPEAALGTALDLRLNLSDEQRRKVTDILRAHRPEMIALRRSVEPQMTAIRDRQIREIRPLLDPRQQKALDELIQELSERQKRLLTDP